MNNRTTKPKPAAPAPAAPGGFLVVEDLCKVYGQGENQVVALDHVSLTIEKGDFSAIIGPSGSGKSTMLHAIAGVDVPTAGRVLLAGGGGMNGSLLAAGCIDELSLVVASVAEGDPKAVSLFAASPFAPDFAGAAFRLVEAKPWEGDALWLHYRAE